MVQQLGQALRMKTEKCKRSRGRARLAHLFIDVRQTLNIFVTANPSTLIIRILRCGLAMNNGVLAIVPKVFFTFSG
jgi:uracil phosphoribosyltransferase